MLAKIVNREEVSSAADALYKIKESVATPTKISSFTHNFYKYPACFPETFPRSVMRSFSNKGDWVLDPFVGGGTTAVEALANNRHFVGFDINDLAVFSSRFKTVLLDAGDIAEINNLLKDFTLPVLKNSHLSTESFFFENVPKNVSNFVVRLRNKLSLLERPRAYTFCLGVLLRTVQLELDRDYDVMNPRLDDQYLNLVDSFLEKNLNFQASVGAFGSRARPMTKIYKSDMCDPQVIEKYSKTIIREFDLVVTSPPYPQRHILYNKWQVQGRTETRLPYWIIDSKDDFPEPHYTMGGRDSQISMEVYLSSIHSAFSNVNRVLKKGGLVVQVIAFNDMAKQFFQYLDAMNEAGFEEVKNIDKSSYDGRLWRKVPNQKWYNRNKGRAASCKELVLFHRKKRGV